MYKTKLDNLADRVRNECRDAYFATEHYGITPAVGTANEADIVSYLCNPRKFQFSKFNPLIPKILREYIDNPSKKLGNPGDLTVFHYKLNKNRMKKGIDWIKQAYKSKDDSDFIDSFMDEYGRGSAMFVKNESHSQWTYNLPMIVGNDVMYDIMDFVKKNKDGVIDLVHEIIEEPRKNSIQDIKDNVGHVNIYDLVYYPKEVKM